MYFSPVIQFLVCLNLSNSFAFEFFHNNTKSCFIFSKRSAINWPVSPEETALLWADSEQVVFKMKALDVNRLSVSNHRFKNWTLYIFAFRNVYYNLLWIFRNCEWFADGCSCTLLHKFSTLKLSDPMLINLLFEPNSCCNPWWHWSGGLLHPFTFCVTKTRIINATKKVHSRLIGFPSWNNYQGHPNHYFSMWTTDA